MVARCGFEPQSQGPKPRMIGRYTTGLQSQVLPHSNTTVLIYKLFAENYIYLFTNLSIEAPRWLSLVERLLGKQKAAGSNPARGLLF